MATVSFVGTGEAFDPELPNSSVLYRGGITLLVDVGPTVPQALFRARLDPELLDAIYLTHRHADHTFGLPALLLWMKEEGRRRPLEVIGGAGIGPFVTALLELGYPGSYRDAFPILPVELEPGAELVRGSATLRNAESRHGERNLALRIDEGGRSFCHSGDGRPSDATRELYRGASLLSHECYFLEGESASHARLAELLELRQRCRVETLALLHVGRHERLALTEDARCVEPGVVIPRPGDELAVGSGSKAGD